MCLSAVVHAVLESRDLHEGSGFLPPVSASHRDPLLPVCVSDSRALISGKLLSYFTLMFHLFDHILSGVLGSVVSITSLL